MKVAITGHSLGDSLARNLAVTFQAMGHEVLLVDSSPLLHYDHPLGRFLMPLAVRYHRFEVLISDQVAATVVRARPDLFISCWGWLRPEAVARIRDAGVIPILLFPDSIANLDRQYVLIAPYRLILSKEPYAVRLFRDKIGLPIHYLPEACNPMWHKPVSLTEMDRERYGCDLTTAGTMYPYRTRMLEIFAGYDVKLWGGRWPAWLKSPMRPYHRGQEVFEHEKARAFGAAKIVINTLHYSEIEGVNCRTFEAAGCGAFQIVDWKPALPELFEPDKEVVTFVSLEELKDKVDFYLRHSDQRRCIAEAGRCRAHRDHTYELRINRILQLLSLPETKQSVGDGWNAMSHSTAGAVQW